MDKRFTALRVIGTILKILAWISLITGLLLSVGLLIFGFTLGPESSFLGLNFGSQFAALAGFIVVLVLAVVSFLGLYAVGESVYVFLSIEENTRRTAYIAQQEYTSTQAHYLAQPSPAEHDD